MRGDKRPIIGSADGMLVERSPSGTAIWILSDLTSSPIMPCAPGNAALATALINRLRAANGVVVFDETIRGTPRVPQTLSC
jgi:hypothetical protein